MYSVQSCLDRHTEYINIQHLYLTPSSSRCRDYTRSGVFSALTLILGDMLYELFKL